MSISRGRVIRDTANGDGIVSINGQQTVFALDKHWKSDLAPTLQMVVDVEFNEAGELVGIKAVPESELAKEEIKRLAGKTQQEAGELMGKALQAGTPVLQRVVAEIGVPAIASIGAILIGWMFLNAISVHIYANTYQGATFYDLMRMVNNNGNLQSLAYGGSSGAGFYGFLCFVALISPLVPHLVKVRYAWLAYAVPLLLMLFTVLGIYLQIRSGISDGQEALKAFGGERMGQIMDEMLAQMLRAVSMGAGFYLSMIGSVYLAGKGVFKFLATR